MEFGINRISHHRNSRVIDRRCLRTIKPRLAGPALYLYKGLSLGMSHLILVAILGGRQGKFIPQLCQMRKMEYGEEV